MSKSDVDRFLKNSEQPNTVTKAEVQKVLNMIKVPTMREIRKNSETYDKSKRRAYLKEIALAR